MTNEVKEAIKTGYTAAMNYGYDPLDEIIKNEYPHLRIPNNKSRALRGALPVYLLQQQYPDTIFNIKQNNTKVDIDAFITNIGKIELKFGFNFLKKDLHIRQGVTQYYIVDAKPKPTSKHYSISLGTNVWLCPDIGEALKNGFEELFEIKSARFYSLEEIKTISK